MHLALPATLLHRIACVVRTTGLRLRGSRSRSIAEPTGHLLRLRPDRAARIPRDAPSITCMRGCVWLTVADDPQDRFLTSGEAFDVPRDRAVVVQAQDGREAVVCIDWRDALIR
ncbi:MAG: DUF2917 domain-containing protein [Burkholderiales bacterium]|nr:DUF2917 domain-containing protein [Burkholderiales bacterium]